ncbi:hypothetical protein FOZ61_007994 [Perkinsus olseni]|uniref:Uncharacterized protein n=1 Tax=Perkinsus olseni TaxID=32597 RepID=A0A7J6L6K8_PEROL|nr:hypothetical protein FOZ61_007994 [Perkinsus olseni]
MTAGASKVYSMIDEDDGDIIDEPTRTPFVDTVKFNAVIGLFIILNMLFIGLEADASPTGRNIMSEQLLEDATANNGVQCKSPAEEIKERLFWFISENIFTVVFLLEMILRLKTHRLSYFMDGWNLMDFALVWLAVVDTWILPLVSECAASDVRALTALRVVRMLRLVRFVRLLRMFKELWLIVEGLVHSVRTLAWVAVFLVCLIYVCAIFLTMQVGHNHEAYLGALSYDGTEWAYSTYFGTVPRSMLTLWQVITLDNWADGIVRHVIHQQPLMGFLFILLILSTTYGLLNIVVGVIVENTLGTATRTQEQVEQEKEEEKKSAANSLRRIFELSDVDQSGTLSQAEFRAAWKMREVQEKFETLGIPMKDAEQLFRLMDPDGTGEIKLTEFLASCMQLVSNSQMGHRDIVQLSMLVENSSKKVDSLGRKIDSLEGTVKAFNLGITALPSCPRDRSVYFSLGSCTAVPFHFVHIMYPPPPPPGASYQLPRFKAKFVGNNSQDGYTEYFIEVSNLSNGDKWTVSRRYREIRELHDHLKLKYPDRIPKIPGKKLWGTMDPHFIEERQRGLQAYMDGVLAIEPDVRTRVLQKFLGVDSRQAAAMRAPSPTVAAVEPGAQPLGIPPQGPPVAVQQPEQQSSSPIPAKPSVPSPAPIVASSGPPYRGPSSEPGTPAVEELPETPVPFTSIIPILQQLGPEAANQLDVYGIVDRARQNYFDLSAQPSLIDADEVTSRKQRYAQLLASRTFPVAAEIAEKYSDGPITFEMTEPEKTIQKEPIGTREDIYVVNIDLSS